MRLAVRQQLANWRLQWRDIAWPLASGLLVVVLSVYVYWQLDHRQQQVLQLQTADRAAKLVTAVEAEMAAREAALRRLAKRWQASGGMAKQTFLRQAQMAYEDFPGFQAVQWIDASYTVRWVEPLAGNEAVVGMQSAFESRRRQALERARETGKTMVTSVINLVQGGKGFLLYIPMYAQRSEGHRAFDGFVLAVFRINDWLRHAMSAPLAEHQYLGLDISLGGEPVFSRRANNPAIGVAWSATQVIDFYGQPLKFTAYPPQRYVDSHLSLWPKLVLAAGSVLAMMLMLFMGLWRYSVRMRQVQAKTQGLLMQESKARDAAEEALHRLAHYDELTELPNRRFFEEKLKAAIGSHYENGAKFALAYMDLDGFKPINDQFGHPVGDRVLRLVAKTLSEKIRGFDVVARVGGDEFLLLLLPIKGSEEAMLAAQRIGSAIAELDCVVSDGSTHKLALAASIGVAVFPVHGQTAEDLVTAADSAMYESKKAGKNRCTLAAEVN